MKKPLVSHPVSCQISEDAYYQFRRMSKVGEMKEELVRRMMLDTHDACKGCRESIFSDDPQYDPNGRGVILLSMRCTRRSCAKVNSTMSGAPMKVESVHDELKALKLAQKIGVYVESPYASYETEDMSASDDKWFAGSEAHGAVIEPAVKKSSDIPSTQGAGEW